MNLFKTLYSLICTYIFNNEGVVDGVLADEMQHLVATLFSTSGWIFVMCIPFLVCYWFIKVVCTGFGRW